MIQTTTSTPEQAIAYAMETEVFAPMLAESAERTGAVLTYRRVCEVTGPRAELGIILLLAGFPGAVNGWFAIRSTCDEAEKDFAEKRLKQALKEFVAGLIDANASGRS